MSSCAYVVGTGDGNLCAMVAANVVMTISDAGSEDKVNVKHQEYVYAL